MASIGSQDINREKSLQPNRFVDHLAQHPAHAAAKTLRQVQGGRASLYGWIVRRPVDVALLFISRS
jgi:hypothetical protein